MTDRMRSDGVEVEVTLGRDQVEDAVRELRLPGGRAPGGAGRRGTVTAGDACCPAVVRRTRTVGTGVDTIREPVMGM